MAERLYFYIKNDKVRSRIISFEWHSGLSVSQKQKNIAVIHHAIRSKGFTPLEISTKSTEELGRKLSAFCLRLDGHFAESIYQSSKVFEQGGPYRDLLDAAPKEARTDERIRNSGSIICFRYNGMEWPGSTATAFYDYIYYHAVRASLTSKELQELSGYDAFTDIEYNPNRSAATQARSAGLVVLALKKYGDLPEFLQEEFLEFVGYNEQVRG